MLTLMWKCVKVPIELLKHLGKFLIQRLRWLTQFYSPTRGVATHVSCVRHAENIPPEWHNGKSGLFVFRRHSVPISTGTLSLQNWPVGMMAGGTRETTSALQATGADWLKSVTVPSEPQKCQEHGLLRIFCHFVRFYSFVSSECRDCVVTFLVISRSSSISIPSVHETFPTFPWGQKLEESKIIMEAKRSAVV
jgi:hypothetical protein